MEFVEPKVEFLPVGGNSPKNLLLKLERCIRVCYKSEDKIADGSAERLISAIVKSGHTSVLEHVRIKLSTDDNTATTMGELNRFLKVEWDGYNNNDKASTVSGNLRAFYDLLESSMLPSTIMESLYDCLMEVFPCIYEHAKHMSLINEGEDAELPRIEYLGEDTEYFTAHIVTSRDVLQQLARNRTISPTVESTRFCNYNKKGINFCIDRPWKDADDLSAYWKENDNKDLHEMFDQFTHHNFLNAISECKDMTELMLVSGAISEQLYNRGIELGCTPQECRRLLPGMLKTELFYTGTHDDWQWFCKLRCANGVQPECKYIADQIKSHLDGLVGIKYHPELFS